MSKKKAVAKAGKEGFIIDSSIAIAWCFPDEKDDYSPAVFGALASEEAFVPDLWHLEVANAAGRRGPQTLDSGGNRHLARLPRRSADHRR